MKKLHLAVIFGLTAMPGVAADYELTFPSLNDIPSESLPNLYDGPVLEIGVPILIPQYAATISLTH